MTRSSQQKHQKNQTQPELLTRASVVRSNSASDDNRSIDAVLATDDPVEIYDWHLGRIQEVLLMDGARYADSIPLLDAHSRYSVKDVLGSTRDIRVEQGTPNQLIGRNYYADTDDAVSAYRKARDGHLTDNSVGYNINVNRSVIIPKGENATIDGRKFTASKTMPLRIVREWTIKENSVCPIGADPAAKHRNQPQPTEFNIMLTEEQKRHIQNKGFDPDTLTEEQCRSLLADYQTRTDPGNDNSDGQRHDSTINAVNAAAQLRDEGMRAEQERQRKIRQIAGDFIPAELVERAINQAMSIDQAQGLFYEHTTNTIATAQAQRNIPGVPAAIIRNNQLNTRTLEAGLLLRSGMDDVVVKEYGEQTADIADRNYRDMALMDVCRLSCHLDNVNVPTSRNELIRAALSTVSLPQILSNVANKALLRGYQSTPATWRQWCNVGTLADFKEHKRVRLTDVGNLEELLPSGEFAHGSLTEEYETIQAETKGKVLTIGRKHFIDDDQSILTKIPSGIGIKSAMALTKMVYTHFLGNPSMGDGNDLFDASNHSNLNTTNPLSASGLNTALQAFMEMTDADGEPIEVNPKYLLVPPDLAATAKALLQSDMLIATGVGSSAATTPASNIHKGVLDLVIENRLSNSNYTGYSTEDYYIIGDNAVCDTVEVGFLNGRQTPYLDRYSNIPGFLGVMFQIYFDAGVKAMDWRTMQKNDAS